MIPFILLLVAYPATAQRPMEVVDLPGNPEHGLRMDAEGRLYMVRIDDNGVRGVRYTRSGSTLREDFVFPQTFHGPLEFLVLPGGFVIVDHESGIIWSLDEAGEERWQAPAGLPGIARLDPNGSVWLTTRGGIWQKTPDSSEIEPVLSTRGAEMSAAGMLDIAPVERGAFYSLDDRGQVHFHDRSGRSRLLGQREAGKRIIASRLGGVLLVEHSGKLTAIHHVTSDGEFTEIWRGGPEIADLRHASRTGDGRIILGAPAPRGGGRAYIIDPEGGR